MDKPHKRSQRIECRHDKEPTARITHYGALLFSEVAIHQFKLATAYYCRLYFDRERVTIGIALVASTEQGEGGDSLPTGVRRVYTTSNSAYTMVTSVLNTYNIALATDVQCPVVKERYGDIDLLAVNLTPAVKAAGRGTLSIPCRPKPKQPRRRISD